MVDRELKDIVIESLRGGAKHTRQVADDIGFTITQISNTICYLKKKKLVEVARKKGGATYYRLAPNLNHIKRHDLAKSLRIYCYENNSESVNKTDPILCLSKCDKVSNCKKFREVWDEWSETICKPLGGG